MFVHSIGLACLVGLIVLPMLACSPRSFRDGTELRVSHKQEFV